MGTTGAVQRAFALFVPKRSALRRGSDRAEVAARWVLLIVGLLVVPVALTVGTQVTADLAPQVAAERAERHQVTGEVLAAPDPATAYRTDVVPDALRAPVRWIAADGTPREALVPVSAGARPGDPHVLWVDAGDRATDAPRLADYPAAQGVLATLVILLGDLVLSLVLLTGLRRVLDRVRRRQWEAAWRRFTGPDHESTR
ncbi:hypothetical protein PHK61_14240 [Actinomycetospora lutea]|uniref:Rv1733c family protein n=1 Tax=Actinomycetospora lutea TaxID=663604 RepID=UPI00236536D1|nr:hypothetical protein [Actinomycetospora lutea]MDD7939579.1 hypothetical protein [Actinomycetospora lutea]